MFDLQADFCSKLQVDVTRINIVLLKAVKRKSKMNECPMASKIVRQSTKDEKACILTVRKEAKFQVVAVIIWNFMAESDARQCMMSLRACLPHAKQTRRGCERNKKIGCTCNGPDAQFFTFGCTMNRFTQRCRFRGKDTVCKYGMQDPQAEEELALIVEEKAFQIDTLMAKVCPLSFCNMYNASNSSCRLGMSRCFSSCSMSLNYSTHLHTDGRDVKGGCTAVLSLEDSPDSQYHVIAGYNVIGSTSVDTMKTNSVDDTTNDTVGIALSNGSVLFEVSKLEMHGSTTLKEPWKNRLSLVYFTHENLHFEKHGKI